MMKILNFTMKAALCLLLMFGTAQNAVSQVTIGSGNEPHPAALLDLNQGLVIEELENLSKGGLLLPRVALESLTLFAPLGAEEDRVAGMIVYNIANLPEAGLTPGLYYFNGERWRRMLASDANWFFMPTIALDMALTNGVPHTVNLWEKFQQQFLPITGAGRLIASEGAPDTFKPTLHDRVPTDFWFFVTTSDDEEPVFGGITVSAEGVMTYEVLEIPTDETFMNIIFVERY